MDFQEAIPSALQIINKKEWNKESLATGLWKFVETVFWKLDICDVTVGLDIFPSLLTKKTKQQTNKKKTARCWPCPLTTLPHVSCFPTSKLVEGPTKYQFLAWGCKQRARTCCLLAALLEDNYSCKAAPLASGMKICASQQHKSRRWTWSRTCSGRNRHQAAAFSLPQWPPERCWWVFTRLLRHLQAESGKRTFVVAANGGGLTGRRVWVKAKNTRF